MEIINISDKAAFDQLVKESTKPVMVDFWATWCGPCKMVAPMIAQIAAERDDVQVAKVDVDQVPDVASELPPFRRLFISRMARKPIALSASSQKPLIWILFKACDLHDEETIYCSPRL